MLSRLKIKGLALLAACTLIITGCDSFLDAEPEQSLSPDVALEDITGFESLLNSIYHRAQREEVQGYNILIAPDVLADGAYMQEDPSGRFVGQSTNATGSHISFQPDDRHMYHSLYRLINETNHVIDDLDEEVQGASAEAVDEMRGEAYFMRALHFHDAARIYGYEPGREVDGWEQSIVLPTEPTYEVDDVEFEERSTNEEVYQQIESDVQDAIDLLEGGDRGVHYANYAAAHALAARVYLYWEQWDDAIEHAEAALDATDATLIDDEATFETNPFAQESHPESIFELNYDQPEAIGANYSPSAVLTPAQWYDVLPAPELVEDHEEGDYRLHLFAEADEGYDWDTYSIKYNQSGGTYQDNVPIFRTAEMILILAEAHARSGDISTAEEYVHELQEARGVDMPSLNSEGDVIDAVLEERKKEFIFEGHRWFDLKRMEMDIPKPDHMGEAPIPYDDFRILSDLPTNQIENNPALEQNPGY